MNTTTRDIATAPDMANQVPDAQSFQSAAAELPGSQLIAENIPIGLFLYHLEDPSDDRTLRMTYANPAVKTLTGLAPEDLVGKTLDENFPGLRAQGIPQRYADVVRSQTAISFEKIPHGDDRVQLASFAVRAFPLPGNLVGVAFENITARKQAEDRLRESEDRYRDLVEHSHDLICTHDLQGQILSANPAAIKLLGIPPDVLVKRNLRDFLAPEVREQLADYLATIQRDGRARGLLLVQTSAGEKRLWEYDNTLRTQGVAAPIVRGIARDISETKRSEAELKQKLAELQQWYEVMLGREERVLELKREADALRQRLGEPPRYAVELADEQPAAGAPS